MRKNFKGVLFFCWALCVHTILVLLGCSYAAHPSKRPDKNPVVLMIHNPKHLGSYPNTSIASATKEQSTLHPPGVLSKRRTVPRYKKNVFSFKKQASHGMHTPQISQKGYKRPATGCHGLENGDNPKKSNFSLQALKKIGSTIKNKFVACLKEGWKIMKKIGSTLKTYIFKNQQASSQKQNSGNGPELSKLRRKKI